LEGNAQLKEGALKASHGALWELLPIFEYILKHFEDLQVQAQRGDFNDHPGIQSSITLAWNKTAEYYKKTDASVAWMAAVVLHPRFKWKYFDDNWKGNQVPFVRAGKANLKRLWESKYKTDDVIRVERSPEPSRQASFIENILDSIAPSSTANTPRPTARYDQLHWYLQEGPVRHMGVIEYWRSKELEMASAYDDGIRFLIDSCYELRVRESLLFVCQTNDARVLKAIRRDVGASRMLVKLASARCC
jgi:hypothetical protein